MSERRREPPGFARTTLTVGRRMSHHVRGSICPLFSDPIFRAAERPSAELIVLLPRIDGQRAEIPSIPWNSSASTKRKATASGNSARFSVRQRGLCRAAPTSQDAAACCRWQDRTWRGRAPDWPFEPECTDPSRLRRSATQALCCLRPRLSGHLMPPEPRPGSRSGHGDKGRRYPG